MKSMILGDPTLEIPLTLASPIEAHAEWLCQHVLNNKYPDGSERIHHGVAHAARVAIYAKAFSRLRVLLGAAEASNFTEENIKLVMIAALFHDSGREDDGEDRPEWEADSAENCLLYLRKIGIAEARAQAIANLIINKDKDNSDPLVALLHDGDVFDIIRARDKFEATYLTFFKDFYAHALMKKIVRVMKHEIEKLIAQQGDARRALDPEVRAKYATHEQPFNRVLADISAEHYPLIHSLYYCTSGKVLIPAPYSMQISNQGELEISMLQACMLQGKAFLRGLNISVLSIVGKNENAVQCEIRKNTRAATVAHPEGNPHRSTSFCYPGTVPFTHFGFIIIPETKDIISMNNKDSDTGYGNKYGETLFYNPHEKNIALEAILDEFDLGLEIENSRVSKHSEAEIHIRRSNTKGIYLSGVESATYKLMAYYTQQEYKSKTGEELPIFIFRNNLTSVTAFTCSEADVLIYWGELLDTTLSGMGKNIFELKTPAQVRSYCMKGSFSTTACTDFGYHYSTQAQEKVDRLVNEKLMQYKKKVEREVEVENKKLEAANQAVDAWFQNRASKFPRNVGLQDNERVWLMNCSAISAETRVKVLDAIGLWLEGEDDTAYWRNNLEDVLVLCKKFSLEKEIRPKIELYINKIITKILNNSYMWGSLTEIYDLFAKSIYADYFISELKSQINPFLLKDQAITWALVNNDFLLKRMQENVFTPAVVRCVVKRLLGGRSSVAIDISGFVRLAQTLNCFTPRQMISVIGNLADSTAAIDAVENLQMYLKNFPVLRQHLLEQILEKRHFLDKYDIFKNTFDFLLKVLPLSEINATVIRHVNRHLEIATQDPRLITVGHALRYLKWYDRYPKLGRPSAVVLDLMQSLIEKSKSLVKEKQVNCLRIAQELRARPLLGQTVNNISENTQSWSLTFFSGLSTVSSMLSSSWEYLYTPQNQQSLRVWQNSPELDIQTRLISALNAYQIDEGVIWKAGYFVGMYASEGVVTSTRNQLRFDLEKFDLLLPAMKARLLGLLMRHKTPRNSATHAMIDCLQELIESEYCDLPVVNRGLSLSASL